MITIDWNGKIGYGDIISPICQAHTLAIQNECPVTINMYWQHQPGEKFKPSDPETLDQRFDYLFSIARPVDQKITVNSIFEKVSWNHTILPESQAYHNFWLSKLGYNGGKYIVVNSTSKNAEQFIDYDSYKTWKDPLGVDNFDKLIEYYSKDYQVIQVDYSTPIQQAVELYRNCFLAIGYHGSMSWVARYVGCPLLLFSSHKSTTKNSFPWSIVKNNIDDIQSWDLQDIAETSLNNLKRFELEHEMYTGYPNIHRLRSERI